MTLDGPGVYACLQCMPTSGRWTLSVLQRDGILRGKTKQTS